jgi:hypothetical protein
MKTFLHDRNFLDDVKFFDVIKFLYDTKFLKKNEQASSGKSFKLEEGESHL